MNDLQIVMREDLVRSIFRLRINNIPSDTSGVFSLRDPQMSMIHSVIVMNAFVCET